MTGGTRRIVTNPLDGLVDSPKATHPANTVPSFSVRRRDGGWSFVQVNLAPDLKTVVSTTETEPDIKAVAVERFKIAAAKYWTAAEA